MQIFGPANVQNARAVSESLRANAAQPTTHPTIVDTVDQLDISREAQQMLSVDRAADIRSERVADIRAQIATGRYETADKISTAVNRLLDEIA